MTVGPQVVSMVGPLATNCVGIGGSKLLPMYIYIYIHISRTISERRKSTQQNEIKTISPIWNSESWPIVQEESFISHVFSHRMTVSFTKPSWRQHLVGFSMTRHLCIQPSDHAFSYQWSQCSWTYFNQVLGSSKMKRNLEYLLEETTTGTWSCYPLVIQDVWQRPSPIFPQCHIWCAFGCSMAKNVDSTPEKPANQRFPCRRSPPNPSKTFLAEKAKLVDSALGRKRHRASWEQFWRTIQLFQTNFVWRFFNTAGSKKRESEGLKSTESFPPTSKHQSSLEQNKVLSLKSTFQGCRFGRWIKAAKTLVNHQYLDP